MSANPLAEPEDVRTLVRGLKLVRRIMAAPSLAAVLKAEIAPGPGFSHDIPDDMLADYARQSLRTVYHPCGTCRMGAEPSAVVDTKLRVIGVPRLRVADTSIMPTLVSGNTNAPAIMIGERCADFILGR